MSVRAVPSCSIFLLLTVCEDDGFHLPRALPDNLVTSKPLRLRCRPCVAPLPFPTVLLSLWARPPLSDVLSYRDMCAVISVPICTYLGRRSTQALLSTLHHGHWGDADWQLSVFVRSSTRDAIFAGRGGIGARWGWERWRRHQCQCQ